MKIKSFIWTASLALISIAFTGCEIEGRRTETKTSRKIKNAYYGKWKVGDTKGKDYFINLQADGKAKSSQGHGEYGQWRLLGDKALIIWEDGWKTLIYKDGEMFRKRTFAPESPIDRRPIDVSNAVKIQSSPQQ